MHVGSVTLGVIFFFTKWLLMTVNEGYQNTKII